MNPDPNRAFLPPAAGNGGGEARVSFTLRNAMAASIEQGSKLQILVAVLLALLLFTQYLLWIAEDGVRQTYALHIAIQAQTEENAELNERNRALEADVQDLKNGLMAIEERARSDMGMIRPDEAFYRLLDQPPKPVAPAEPPAKPGTRSSLPANHRLHANEAGKPAKPAPNVAKPAAVPAKPAPAAPHHPATKPPAAAAPPR